MQLELWSPSLQPASHAPPAPRRGARAASQAPTVVAAGSIDTLLSVELLADPELKRLQAGAVDFVREARAHATRKAYASDWKFFESWCVSHNQVALPASPATLALYLTHLAQSGRKYSSIRRVRSAIGQVHSASNVGRPDRDGRIRTLERGIGKVIGTREQGAPALGVPELRRAVGALQDSLRDVHDRALLLLGFAGGYRASDLVILEIQHVRFEADGLHVFLPRSKEDQLGRGRTKRIPIAADPALCAARALQRWLELAGLRSGPLFPSIRGSRIEAARMHPRAVSRALQRAVRRAGLDGKYSSHSLRAGLATAADAQGHELRDIQAHVGWRDVRTAVRYIRPSDRASRSVLSGLL
jgi:integrase